MEKLMNDFKELQCVDVGVSQSVAKFSTLLLRKNLFKTQPEGIKNFHIAGSVSEGAALARVFFQKVTAANILNREFEIDSEFVILELDESFKDSVELIPGNLNHVKIHWNENMKSGWKWEIGDRLNELVSSDGYLKSFPMKDIVMNKTNPRVDDKILKPVVAIALDIELNQVSFTFPSHDTTKASVETRFKLLIDNKETFSISSDIVLLIKLNWWPDVAREWLNRERYWPCKDDILRLAHNSYVIAKPSHEEKYKKDSLEFTYAFSPIERALIIKRTSHQHFIYLVFKSMFYKWIKRFDETEMHSFFAKTVMFWMCEELPQDDKMWDDDMESIISALAYLFQKLGIYFLSGHLPYYFIPEVNVIEHCSDMLRNQAGDMCREIAANVVKFVPNNVRDVVSFGRELTDFFTSAHNTMDDILHNKYDVFLKRPDLMPSVIEIFSPALRAEIDAVWKKMERESKRIEEDAVRVVNTFGEVLEVLGSSHTR